jgi:hypothetical protein
VIQLCVSNMLHDMLLCASVSAKRGVAAPGSGG